MKTPWIRLGTCGALAFVLGCDLGDHGAVAEGGAGGAATAGSVTTGSATTGGGGGAGPVSGLPVPPGAGGKAPPSGAAGGLQVLPWAGFQTALSYTFDDAQPSQIEHWADLKAEGIRATFYLNTLSRFTEAGFDTTWKAALASGWELGNHTVHHCYESGTCPNGATFTTVDGELDDASAYITGPAGQAAVWTAAYPYGDTAWEPAAKSRFFLARGTTPGTIAPAGPVDPYALPCIAAVAAGGEPASKFSGDVDVARAAGEWLIFLFHTITPTSQSWYAPTDIGSITGSIDHAKALGDVWIDTVAAVGAYWLGQRLLAAATPSTAGGVTTWSWTLPDHFPKGRFLRVTFAGGKPAQGGKPLAWDGHGYYEVALDAGSLTLSP